MSDALVVFGFMLLCVACLAFPPLGVLVLIIVVASR
jgi:hypothetical protein